MEAEKMLYEVIVGAFGLWYNACLVNDEAKGKGLSTCIQRYGGKYCVAAGSFSSEKAAMERLLKVRKTGYVFAYIINK